jgi:hypothetical protein
VWVVLGLRWAGAAVGAWRDSMSKAMVQSPIVYGGNFIADYGPGRTGIASRDPPSLAEPTRVARS